MSNAVELSSKALLLKLGESIQVSKNRTVSAEKAVSKLLHLNAVDENDVRAVQQLISLRNEASHAHLGDVDPELALFLMFVSYKYFKKIINQHFKNLDYIFKDTFLSISTESNRTYAESVDKLLKAKTVQDKRMLYLLERGVRYAGGDYISQDDFEKEFKK